MIFDPLYLIMAIPGILLAIGASLYLRHAYGSQSKVSAGTGLTGSQVAEILNQKENFGVQIEVTPGQLTDHYDPSREIVAISNDNMVNDSVANIAVVAHEFGHVQQKRVGMALFKARSALVPIVGFGSNIGYVIMIIGFLASTSNLINIGLVLFSTTALFALVTLPIELDASNRAIKLIEKHHLVSPHKINGAKTVLTAAALTYVAALVQQLLTVLYFFIRSRD